MPATAPPPVLCSFQARVVRVSKLTPAQQPATIPLNSKKRVSPITLSIKTGLLALGLIGAGIISTGAGAPPFDFTRIVFVKRTNLQSNHYYTDYINGGFEPGGNLCILDLETGTAREVVSELKGGVFGRFDLSFDAKTVVFAWKKSAGEGYRIYECGIDGSGLRQLTSPPRKKRTWSRSTSSDITTAPTTWTPATFPMEAFASYPPGVSMGFSATRRTSSRPRFSTAWTATAGISASSRIAPSAKPPPP